MRTAIVIHKETRLYYLSPWAPGTDVQAIVWMIWGKTLPEVETGNLLPSLFSAPEDTGLTRDTSGSNERLTGRLFEFNKQSRTGIKDLLKGTLSRRLAR
jgi:hypothetical protein